MTAGPQDDGGEAVLYRTGESRGKVPKCRHTLPWVGQRNHCHLPPMESSKEGRATLTPHLSPTASFPPPKPGGFPFLCLSCEGPSRFETPARSCPEDPIGPRSQGRGAGAGGAGLLGPFRGALAPAAAAGLLSCATPARRILLMLVFFRGPRPAPRPSSQLARLAATAGPG